MDPSEDLPPLLVDLQVANDEGSLDPDLLPNEDENPVKVPLTIVTGSSADVEILIESV